MAMEKVLLQASQPAPAGNAMELADAAATFAVAAAKSNQSSQSEKRVTPKSKIAQFVDAKRRTGTIPTKAGTR